MTLPRVFFFFIVLVVSVSSICRCDGVTEKEKTLAIIKPDGLSGNYSDKIKNAVLDSGFTILKEMIIQLDEDAAIGFYAQHSSRSFFSSVVKYMTRPSGTGRMAKSDYEHHVFFFHVHWFTNGNPIRPMDEIFILADNHLKLVQELVIQSVQLLHDLFVGNKLDSALSKYSCVLSRIKSVEMQVLNSMQLPIEKCLSIGVEDLSVNEPD